MTERDRAVGAILGMAFGDALGAGYEFDPPLAPNAPVGMIGGGAFDWAPGEWTDDTSMAVPLLQVLADHRPLDDGALDDVVAAWWSWAHTAKDVGHQTRKVLALPEQPTAQQVRDSARAVHDSTGRSGGNGSLMRTAPLALGFLRDGAETELADTARAVSDLTHVDVDAGDACVLWSLAIRHAIRTGERDPLVGIDLLPAPRRRRWIDLVAQAERSEPADFGSNGWVVQALQGAWSAIAGSSSPVDALERAVRGGNDTDTVAAIAGGLVGAAAGASAFPFPWVDLLHGWPGLRAADLVALVDRALADPSAPTVAPNQER